MKRLLQNLPKFVRVVEVGPRDGLQNEKHFLVSSAARLELIRKLERSGIRSIEVGSFVSPKWVPQMAATEDIFRSLSQHPSHLGTTYSALTPNIKGMQSAIEAGVKEVAVFAAATESFSQRNINCSVAESVQRFEEVTKLANKHGINVRGYVSCVLGCPYEGLTVTPEKVLEVSQRLLDIGCYEISLGDTIGVGNVGSTSRLMELMTSKISVDKLAVHMHDTYGQALSNLLISLQYGINVVDSSISGLGGCPYAAGASGNVATEDVVYMLNGLGIETNIQIDRLLEAANFIDAILGNRTSGSKYTIAQRNRLREALKLSQNSSDNSNEPLSSRI